MSRTTKINVRELKKYINYEVDYFICSASYEERCLIIPRNSSECSIKNVAIFCNVDFLEFYNENEKKISSFFGSVNPQIIFLNTQRPAPNAFEILNYFDTIEDVENKKFFIDTTTFTHESLLVLYKVITMKEIPSENVLFAYLSPTDYSTNEIDIEKKWLSKGIGEVRNVIGYGGFMNPLKKNHLIVLVGIEFDRTKSLIDKIEPNSLSLGVSIDYTTQLPQTKELNEKRHQELINTYSNVESFEFTVLDPRLVQATLTEIASRHADCNILVAAMNNKISTIGAGSFANSNPEVQILYATALQYNIEFYTKPAQDCFLFMS